MKALHQQTEIIHNRYQITTILGQGGMGTYAAIDLSNSQPVAIKVVDLLSGLVCSIGIIVLYFSILGLRYEHNKKTSLTINNNKFRLQWISFGWTSLVEENKSGNISKIDFVNLNVDVHKSKDENDRTRIVNSCAITIDEEVLKFGDGYNLTEEEANWLVREISAYIKFVQQ